MSDLADFISRRHYVRNHRPVPQLIEMFRRYQCRFCHSWIYYDEAIGSWWHYSEMHHPYGMNDEEWQRHLDTYR